MNTRTDIPQNQGSKAEPEFTPHFVRWITVITLVTLIMILFFRFQNYTRGADSFPSTFGRYYHPDLFSVYPWVVVGGLTVSDGIVMFSSGKLDPISQIVRYSILCGLLIAFIIGPTLFLLGWRGSLKASKEEPGAFRKLDVSVISFIIGGIMILPFVIISVPGAYITGAVYSSMLKSASVQEPKDIIIGEMGPLGWAAAQYYLLPSSLGGGQNSFEQFTIDPKSRWGTDNKNAKYEIVAKTKTSITFKAVSKVFPDGAMTATLDTSLALGQFTLLGKFE